MTAKLIPVSEWAVLTFGKHAPCKVLNRWARMHQFSPEAQKLSACGSYIPTLDMSAIS